MRMPPPKGWVSRQFTSDLCNHCRTKRLRTTNVKRKADHLKSCEPFKENIRPQIPEDVFETFIRTLGRETDPGLLLPAGLSASLPAQHDTLPSPSCTDVEISTQLTIPILNSEIWDDRTLRQSVACEAVGIGSPAQQDSHAPDAMNYTEESVASPCPSSTIMQDDYAYPTLAISVDIWRLASDDLRPTAKLKPDDVFRILQTLFSPNISIVKVGGSFGLDDWRIWTRMNWPPIDSSVHIFLVPLLQDGYWLLVRFDCDERVVIIYSPKTEGVHLHSTGLRDFTSAWADQYAHKPQAQPIVQFEYGENVYDDATHIIVIAMYAFAGTPFLGSYDCDQWRFVFTALVQGHPLTLEKSRKPFGDFSVHGMMYHQWLRALQELENAIGKLKDQLRLVEDQESLISRLYARTDLDLSQLSLDHAEAYDREFRGPHDQPSLWNQLQGIQSEQTKRRLQKDSLQILLRTNLSISQRLKEELRIEMLNYKKQTQISHEFGHAISAIAPGNVSR